MTIPSMDVLSSAVAYSSSPLSTPNENDPRLIILLAWMDARDSHIEKYIVQHRVLYPSSTILVFRSNLKMYMQPSLRRRLFSPAVPILQDLAKTSGDESSFLLHIFSNGGVSSAVTLWDLWEEALGGKDVPRHIAVMDSCPGVFHWKTNYHVLSLGLPFWASPLVWAFLGAAWACYIPWGRVEPQEANALALNTARRIAREVKRVYIYGDGDNSVMWQDVEKHGKQAEKMGASVKMEMFPGGTHVTHARVDGERYWRVVKETWEGKTR